MVNKDRRKVLAKTGAAITGLAFTGVTSAESDTEGLDFSFDPKSERKVFDFVRTFDEIDNKARQERLYNEFDSKLSSEQQKAVFEARKPAEMVIDTEYTPPTSTISQQSHTRSQHSWAASVTLRQITGSIYYRLHHRITWDSSSSSVYNADSSGWVTHVAVGYSDDGNNQKLIHDDGSSFDSYRQRNIAYGVGPLNLTYSPSITMRGYSNGNGSTLDKYDGT